MDLSVKNTTKEQRKKIVKSALALAITGSDFPSDMALQIAKKYVDGLCEIEDVQKETLSFYKEDGDV